jgi:hypothetical protein
MGTFFVTGGIGLFVDGRTVLEDWRYQRQAIRTQAVTTGKTLFLGAVRHAMREWLLRQQGVNTLGTVTELWERNVKIDGVRQWRLHFEFRVRLEAAD